MWAMVENAGSYPLWTNTQLRALFLFLSLNTSHDCSKSEWEHMTTFQPLSEYSLSKPNAQSKNIPKFEMNSQIILRCACHAWPPKNNLWPSLIWKNNKTLFLKRWKNYERVMRSESLSVTALTMLRISKNWRGGVRKIERWWP